jgi:hypothetical protein
VGFLDRIQGSSSATTLIPKAFAVFLAAHGVVHVIGFVVPWQLSNFRDITYKTTIFGGALDAGDAGVKAIGLAWLAVTVAMVLVAVMVWRQTRFAYAACLAILVASLALCATGMPDAVMGLVIDVVLLGLLVAVPGRVVPAWARSA